MRVGVTLGVAVLLACGGSGVGARHSEVGDRTSTSESASQSEPEPESASESASESPSESPPDPHPLVAAFARELRVWMQETEAEPLEGIELTGTAGGDTEKMSELVRHVLFRELGGTAILELGIADLRRYGEDIRAMPETPAGPEDPDDPDWQEGYGGYGTGPHMNVDGMGNLVGELQGQCESSLSDAERELDPNPCAERFVPVWATVKLARTAYLPIDVDTMGFVDPGTPMGGGEWAQAPPRPLHELLAIAERAGLGRSFIAEVAVELLRELTALARTPRDAPGEGRSETGRSTPNPMAG